MLKKIRALTYRYAIPSAFIAFVLIDLLLHGISQLLSLLPQTLPMRFLYQTILMIIPVAIVFLFGFSRAFKNGNFLRALVCGLPFLAVQLIVLAIFFLGNIGNPEANWQPWYMIVYGMFYVVGVGVREECIYRATIQNIVAKKHANSVKGVWITAIIGAVIFGIMHVSNIFSGVNPMSVVVQIISATFAGLLFSAIYLRSGSLWALILIHTLTDMASLSKSTFLDSTLDQDLNSISWSFGELIVYLIYVGLAILLLRPSKCKQIYESLCFSDEESGAAVSTESES